MITKRDIIKIADKIKAVNNNEQSDVRFELHHITALADVIRETNPRFKRMRFIDYIEGRCGPNGGRV